MIGIDFAGDYSIIFDMRNKIIIGCLFLFFLGLANALAETTIKAELDKQRMTTDDTLTYKLSVSSTETQVPQPQMPAFDGFTVISQAQSSTISLMKNGPKTIVIIVYILAPLKTGKFTIQPSQVKIQDKTYASEKFEIEVTQGKAEPRQPESAQPQVTL